MWPRWLAADAGRAHILSAMRVVGKRSKGTGDRPGLDALVLALGGGAPKGVFRYRSHEEANRDQDRWMIERARRRTRTSST